MILLLLMMGVFAFTGKQFHPTWAIALFPVLIILMAALGLGTGMLISAMTTKYRDLAFLLSFGVQLLMYGTTVIYPLSSVIIKYPKFRLFFEANPMTPIIETFRYGFLGKGSFSWGALGYATLITSLLLMAGIIIFNKVEKNFVDTV